MDSPLTTIFDAEISLKYLRVFNFLWKIKSIEFWLNEIWIMHKKFSQDNISEEYRRIITICNVIRHQMLFFIQNLFSYLMLEVIETEWNAFLRNIETVASMDDIIIKHQEFVDNIMRRSMNYNNNNPLKQ
jgi:gamma-tubulin complex component 3